MRTIHTIMHYLFVVGMIAAFWAHYDNGAIISGIMALIANEWKKESK